MEEIDLDTFLKEDEATLAKRGRESIAHVVGELQNYLQHECGEEKNFPTMSFMMSCSRYIHVFTFISFNPLKP